MTKQAIYFYLTPAFIYCTISCYAQTKQQSIPIYDSVMAGQLNLDTVINQRLRYYIHQFGSQQKFEQVFGKPADTLKAQTKRDYELYKRAKQGK